MERSHGHGVQKMDLAWRYYKLLSDEKKRLEKQRDELDEGPERILCMNQLDRAESQMKSIGEGYKQRERFAKRIMDAIGAKHLTPNVLAPLSNEEQQIGAELAWQHHDYLMSLVSMGHEDLKHYVAKPDEVKANKMSCMLGFSDQVPVWVKKGSTKAVFAAHETRTHGKPIKQIRRDLQDELNKQAHDKKLVDEAEHHDALEGENPNESQAALEDKEPNEDQKKQDWQLVTTEDQKDGGRAHLTIKKDSATEKMRITFEAHQLVSNFFNPDEDPIGHVGKGVLIVPGQHARLDNIDDNGRWVEDETFSYLGEMKVHRKGESARRALEQWVKIRRDHPHLLEHYDVYSQPSSNQDNVIMSWVIAKHARMYPASIYQRDCFAASFSDDTMRTMFTAHQIQAIIPPKMTAMMQLTDTDFSYVFKSLVRKSVDKIMAKNQKAMGTSEVYQMSMKDIAQCLHEGMEGMVEKNNERQWVLKGLRRNGFLAMRPGRDGIMKWCGEEPWAKDMPLGSDRIHEGWLKNRLAHVEKHGVITPPNWTRIQGAKELADLVEWMYHSDQDWYKDADIPGVADENTPEWVQASQFQLPLAYRKAAVLRESLMSDEAKEKRKKKDQKVKKRKAMRDAAKGLDDEEKKAIRDQLQERSRNEVLSSMVPSATRKGSQNKKKDKKISFMKKVKKNYQKQMKKKALGDKVKEKALEKNALEDKKDEKNALEDAKHGKHEQDDKKSKQKKLPLEGKKDEKGKDEANVPLPPPAFAPPDGWEGKIRVTNELAGQTLYGRQGEALGVGEDEVHLVLEEDWRNKGDRKAWVKKEWITKVRGDEKVWRWPQLSMTRDVKLQMLYEAGLYTLDLDYIDQNGDVEIISEKSIKEDGIDTQTLVLGWALLRVVFNGKSMNELDSVRFMHPSMSYSLIGHQQNEHGNKDLMAPWEKVSEHAKRLFADKEKVFLIPIPAGGHWTLLVLDLRKDVPFDRQVRYYETLEIPSDLSKESAELLLASLLSLGIIDEKFLDRPSLERNNGVIRQKKGSNQCGVFVLAYMEQEVAEAMGYGPAAIGWPWVAAQNWISKMRKLGEQLQVERNKRIKDLKKLDEKDKTWGEDEVGGRRLQIGWEDEGRA